MRHYLWFIGDIIIPVVSITLGVIGGLHFGNGLLGFMVGLIPAAISIRITPFPLDKISPPGHDDADGAYETVER